MGFEKHFKVCGMSSFNKKTRRTKGGFTLVEALAAILLIGIAIASIVASNNAFTRANAFGVQLSTAEFLIEQVRERSVSLAFDDLDDFAGLYSPPQDVCGDQLNDLSAFSQQVTVEHVSPTNFEVAEADSGFLRITVNILCGNSEVSSASWIRTRY